MLARSDLLIGFMVATSARLSWLIRCDHWLSLGRRSWDSLPMVASQSVRPAPLSIFDNGPRVACLTAAGSPPAHADTASPHPRSPPGRPPGRLDDLIDPSGLGTIAL